MAVATGLAAYVAYHRRLPVIQSRVSGEIALDLELLTAVLARVAVMLRMLAHEVRSQGLPAGADQTADDAGELAFIVELVVREPLVPLGQMSDHRGSLAAPKVARHARESFLISRHRVGERGVLLHIRFTPTLDFRRMRELVSFQ